MPDWVISGSVLAQAVCTVLLAGLTGWYAYSVRRQVKQDREFFDRKAAETRELVERQSAEYQEREHQQVERAILAVIAELQIDLQEGAWDFQKAPPLLDATFAGNLWAVQQIAISLGTFRLLGDAYLSIQRYNLLYDAATDAERAETWKRNASQVAWNDAQRSIQAALATLAQDPATSRLFGPTRSA